MQRGAEAAPLARRFVGSSSLCLPARAALRGSRPECTVARGLPLYPFHMSKVFAIAILTTGILALAYGAFGNRQRAQEANVGPLEIGVALAIVSGGVLTRQRS